MKYSDLKLIDELLCDLKAPGESWADVERKTSITRYAMARLRKAHASGEMPVITLGLANYFASETPAQETER